MLSEWLSFTGRVVLLEWGKSVFTVLPIPDEVAATLASSGAKRIEIELNDHPFNMALTKAPTMTQTFVYTGKSILKETGISPGEEIEVRVCKADPNVVVVPGDVKLAIRGAELNEKWSDLTPGKQRGLLHTVNTAKREETRIRRIRRIEKLISVLRG